MKNNLVSVYVMKFMRTIQAQHYLNFQLLWPSDSDVKLLMYTAVGTMAQTTPFIINRVMTIVFFFVTESMRTIQMQFFSNFQCNCKNQDKQHFFLHYGVSGTVHQEKVCAGL